MENENFSWLKPPEEEEGADQQQAAPFLSKEYLELLEKKKTKAEIPGSALKPYQRQQFNNSYESPNTRLSKKGKHLPRSSPK